jgi:hypothetical protein
MKPRHLARLTAGVAAITIVIAVASTSAAGSSATVTTSVPAPSAMRHMATMHDGSDDRMPGPGMTGMHSGDMDTVHVSMHEQMRGAVPDQVLTECDEMHAGMSAAHAAGTTHATHHGSPRA